MVLPIGGQMLMEDEVPSVVKTFYAKFWFAFTVILLVDVICSFVVGNFFGGVVNLCVVFLAFYMARNNCEMMSQQCLLGFGMMCFLQVAFELITFINNVSGRIRMTSTNEEVNINGVNEIVDINKVKNTPFFDAQLGFMYNFQAVLMIFTPIILMSGILLCWLTYKEFPSSMFGESGLDLEGDARYAGQGPAQGNSLVGGYSGTYGGSAIGAPINRPPPVRPFEGQGQRLGNSSDS